MARRMRARKASRGARGYLARRPNRPGVRDRCNSAGNRASATGRTSPPDLVVTDHQMPGMDDDGQPIELFRAARLLVQRGASPSPGSRRPGRADLGRASIRVVSC